MQPRKYRRPPTPLRVVKVKDFIVRLAPYGQNDDGKAQYPGAEYKVKASSRTMAFTKALMKHRERLNIPVQVAILSDGIIEVHHEIGASR